MPTFWNQFGNNYDQVNQNTGGMADYVRGLKSYLSPQQAPAPAPVPEPVSTPAPVEQPTSPLIAGMSAFDKSFIQTSPAARIAQWVTNQIPGLKGKVESAIQGTEQARQEHPLAAGIGGVGGVIGGIASPNLPTGGLPSVVANAAVTGAPYAAMAGVDKYKETGDPIAAAKQAAVSELLGVGAGTAIGSAGLAFGKLAKAAHPVLNEVDAASYGLVGRDISRPEMEFARKMGVNPKAYLAEKGEGQLDKVMTLLREQGGRSKQGIQNAAKWVTDSYNTVNQTFKEAGAQLSSKMSDILNAPIVQTMKGKFNPGEVDNTITQLVNQVDNRVAAGPKGWTDARTFLNEQMQRGIEIGKNATGKNLDEVQHMADMGEMLQDSASVVKAHMNELTHNVLDSARAAGQQVPDLEALDQIYSAYPSLRETLARRAGKPMGSFAGGSESTAGLGSTAALGGMLGGPAGAAAGKVLGATAMAPLLKRGVGYLTNQVMGRTAAGLDTALQKGAELTSSGSMAARLPGAVAGNEQELKPPQDEISSDPQASKNADTIAVNEQTLPSEASAAALVDSRSALQNTIDRRLYDKWNSWNNPLKPDFQTFYDTTKAWSGNFDPSRQETMKILGGADFKKYQQAYISAMNMKKMGPNLLKAISYGGLVGPGVISSLTDPLGKEEHDNLVNAIWSASSGDAKPPGKEDRAQIEERLADLRKLANRGQLNNNKAFAHLLDIMKSEGLPVEQLKDMGAFNG